VHSRGTGKQRAAELCVTRTTAAWFGELPTRSTSLVTVWRQGRRLMSPGLRHGSPAGPTGPVTVWWQGRRLMSPGLRHGSLDGTTGRSPSDSRAGLPLPVPDLERKRFKTRCMTPIG